MEANILMGTQPLKLFTKSNQKLKIERAQTEPSTLLTYV